MVFLISLSRPASVRGRDLVHPHVRPCQPWVRPGWIHNQRADMQPAWPYQSKGHRPDGQSRIGSSALRMSGRHHVGAAGVTSLSTDQSGVNCWGSLSRYSLNTPPSVRLIKCNNCGRPWSVFDQHSPLSCRHPPTRLPSRSSRQAEFNHVKH